ncbi:MAG: DUF1028 domain-containing protein [Planctomycetota bacterium]
MQRPVHTYSIVARDPKTGELGVAVQSHWFSVGSIVSWAEAGVGAVATQSFVDPAYGPRGLELMGSGMSAPQTLKSLLASDAGRAVRQVAMVDSQGRLAAHTGEKCIQWAGHHIGENYSCQANMMLNERVVPSMAKAFEAEPGDLAQRLLAALEAAQESGGDIRGQQSAAILVVKGTSTGRVWEDRILDLRVEDHPAPVRELRRLVTVQSAYRHMNAGDAAMETGDMESALREYAAAAKLVPENLEVVYWNAITLATNGQLEAALPLFQRVFAKDRNWIILTERLPQADLLSNQLAERILKEARR